MHVHAHEVAAILSGVLLTVLAFMPRLGLADRLVSAFVGVAFIAYGMYTGAAVDQVELPPYVFAVPFITVLWLLGGIRGPVPANITADERRTADEHHVVRSAEVLLSPALWAELPPPPISPAVGVPVPTAPRVAGTYAARPALAPAAESLFTPAMPAAPAHRVCSACGRQRDDGAKFCGGCGKPFLVHATALTPAPVRPGVRTAPPPPPTVPIGVPIQPSAQPVARPVARPVAEPVARRAVVPQQMALPPKKPQAAPAPAAAEPRVEPTRSAERPISPTYRLRNLRGEYEPPASVAD